MFKLNSLRTIALAATLFAAGAPAIAGAATGQATVTVTVPSMIILDYFSKINLGLASQDEKYDHVTYSKTGVDATGEQTVEGSEALTSGTLAKASSAALNGGDVTLSMKNAWAVRGFSSNGTATVNVSGPESLTNAKASTSTIAVKKLQVSDGKTSSNSITTALSGIGKATMGDLIMSLNFGNTTVSGDYTGTITITATAI